MAEDVFGSLTMDQKLAAYRIALAEANKNGFNVWQMMTKEFEILLDYVDQLKAERNPLYTYLEMVDRGEA